MALLCATPHRARCSRRRAPLTPAPGPPSASAQTPITPGSEAGPVETRDARGGGGLGESGADEGEILEAREQPTSPARSILDSFRIGQVRGGAAWEAPAAAAAGPSPSVAETRRASSAESPRRLPPRAQVLNLIWVHGVIGWGYFILLSWVRAQNPAARLPPPPKLPHTPARRRAVTPLPPIPTLLRTSSPGRSRRTSRSSWPRGPSGPSAS